MSATMRIAIAWSHTGRTGQSWRAWWRLIRVHCGRWATSPTVLIWTTWALSATRPSTTTSTTRSSSWTLRRSWPTGASCRPLRCECAGWIAYGGNTTGYTANRCLWMCGTCMASSCARSAGDGVAGSRPDCPVTPAYCAGSTTWTASTSSPSRRCASANGWPITGRETSR